MRIAITGTSSTGKTTLAKALLESSQFNARIKTFLTADARNLLRKLDFRSMDLMNREQLKNFQLEYFAHKKEIEDGKDDFVTDRSFVDVAAYWQQRDAFDLPAVERDPFVMACEKEAGNYHLHFYVPMGLFKFESDGYRSEDQDLHKRIDTQIRESLKKWRLYHITLNTPSLEERIRIVLKAVEAYNA